MDIWAELKRAEEAGWVDPGFTEPLDETLARARKYLEQMGSKGAAPSSAEVQPQRGDPTAHP